MRNNTFARKSLSAFVSTNTATIRLLREVIVPLKPHFVAALQFYLLLSPIFSTFS